VQPGVALDCERDIAGNGYGVLLLHTLESSNIKMSLELLSSGCHPVIDIDQLCKTKVSLAYSYASDILP
jgi:hypothetical protein